MSRKPNLLKRNRGYILPVIDTAKMGRINKVIPKNLRWRVIVTCALENKTSADIAAEKIIFSNSDRNKDQPVSARTIRCEVMKLSKEVGFKVTINGLNLYGQRRRIFDD